MKGLVDMAEGRRRVVSEGLTHTLAGEERHVIYHFSVSPGCEDTWEKMIVSVIDLTAQKQVERTLTDVNARLEKEEAQRRLLSQSLMEIIENDRRGVAMELHDHFGQMMTTLKLNLEMLAAGLAGSRPLAADASGGRDGEGDADHHRPQEVRLRAHAQHDREPGPHSVAAGTRSTMSRERRASRSSSSRAASRSVFDREKELALYRIAQESINNVVKHAHARRVHVNLISQEGVASLSIEDDGVGFAYSEEAHMLWRGRPAGAPYHAREGHPVRGRADHRFASRPGRPRPGRDPAVNGRCRSSGRSDDGQPRALWSTTMTS